MAKANNAGVEALRRVTATEPPTWLEPNPALSETARAASQYLFSSLRPFTPKSPLDQLLVDGFDAEQIWQQIDLQSQPLVSTLRRRVRELAKNPEEIFRVAAPSGGGSEVETIDRGEWDEENDGLDEELDEADEDEDEEMVEREEGEGGEEEEEDDDDDDEEEDEDEEEMEDGDEEGGERKKKEGEGGGIEDKFLKIDELTEYLEKEEENFEEEDDEDDEETEDDDEESDEAGDFGKVNVKVKGKGKGKRKDDDDDEDDDDHHGKDEEAEGMEMARYKGFFGGKKEKGSKRKAQLLQESEDSGDEDDMDFDEQKKGNSTHEKQLEKIQSKIEEMEKANIEPKTWTMTGEVTAAKRPKNSALEVDLDFEHNVRPAPVVTEEFTASIEDIIKKRILEGHFNDVQRASKLPSKAPRESKELDDSKSKQGLAELYEEEYVQKTDPSSAPLSFKDELKNEAGRLFKKLCLKLDALSHFNFAPKPVIEDMSFQTNVPALAMEEIAPVAVSDAALLAPEEVFDGKGDVKEEGELTKEERKRRRANKKRKFKAEAAKRPVKKVPEGPSPVQVNG